MLHEAIACFILAQTEGFEQSSGEALLRGSCNNWGVFSIMLNKGKTDCSDLSMASNSGP